MKTNHLEDRIDTTLGDLIIAVNDAAFEFYEDKRKAYILASLALEDILKRAHVRTPKHGESQLRGSEESLFIRWH